MNKAKSIIQNQPFLHLKGVLLDAFSESIVTCFLFKGLQGLFKTLIEYAVFAATFGHASRVR